MSYQAAKSRVGTKDHSRDNHQASLGSPSKPNCIAATWHYHRNTPQGRFIALNAIPNAPPLITFSACLNVKLILSPLSFLQSPALNPSSTSESPINSILATPPLISFISSTLLSAIPCKCDAYKLDERIRSDRGSRRS